MEWKTTGRGEKNKRKEGKNEEEGRAAEHYWREERKKRKEGRKKIG